MENKSSSKLNIELVFELIQEGKNARKTDLWEAADKFVQARILLSQLAEEQPRSTEEEKAIADLYERQAWEYLGQSRDCLIEAMALEKERDEKEKSLFSSNLSEKDAGTRIHSFLSLFSRNLEAGEGEINESNLESQMSIEDRLHALNASLPSGFKTSDERMLDINHGLNKLGISLYTQKQPFAGFIEDEIPKDEDEQVSDIIAQAQDEITFENKFSVGSDSKPTPTLATFDDDIEEADSDEEEEEEEDAFLNDDLITMKKIRRRTEKAQVKLAELVSLLDEARAAKEREDKEEDDVDSSDDDGSSGVIAKPDSQTHLLSVKLKINGARRDLKRAMEDFLEDLA
jgi:hypothetical protein